MGLSTVLPAYRRALSLAPLFTALHLSVRLAASVLVLPLAGVLIC